ncbi:hypothetical protein ACO0QE_002242 [Hanseniaspora vineae]
MRIFSRNKDRESPTESQQRNYLEIPTIVTRNSPANTKHSSRSDSPRTPTTPLSIRKNGSNSSTSDSLANFDPLMPPTITSKKRSNSFTNLLRAMSPSANSMNHHHNMSPSRESQMNQLSSANLMTKALSPELVPVVTLLSAQAHRRYHVGVFLIFYDLNNEGQPAERVWKEQYAVLIGTQLALWNASDLQISRNKKFTSKEMTEKLFSAASKPSYINFTDAKFKILPDRENTLVVSTTMKNRYFFKFSDKQSFHMWHSTFRLCTFEYSSLQEAYTGAFLSAKGAKLSDINVILADTKFQYEDWVSVRFGAGMPWKRCYAVVSQPTKKPKKKKSKTNKKGSSKHSDADYYEDDEYEYPQGAYGEVTFYENEKKIGNKKYAMARIHSAISVYAIYPSSPLLIDDSTMLKIEGMVTFGKDDKDPKESDIFIMPEKHFAVAGYDTIIRFLVPMLNAFYLYGRPKRLISTKDDPNSLLFGLPTLPEIHYLQVKDLLPLMEQNISESWSNKVWKRQIKKLLLTKLRTGYSGCGSASGYSGALISPSITSVELFKKGTSPQIQPISRFVSEGLPVAFTQTTEINSTAFHNLKTPVTQTAPVNLVGSSTKSKQSSSPIKKELTTSSTQIKTSPNGVTSVTATKTTTATETAYAKTPLKAVKSHQKYTNQPPKSLDTKFYSPQKSTVPVQSPSSPYQQYKSNHSGSAIFNPENETGSQQNAAVQKASTPLKNQHQTLNQQTMLSNADNLQELDIGRDSETSADSIVLPQLKTEPKSDFSKARKQHASMNSESLQNSIIDSYQNPQNAGPTVDGKKIVKKVNKNEDDNEDYVIGGNKQKKDSSVDPLADFYNLSRTLSSYKPLTSQTAQKRMSEEKPRSQQNTKETDRPELAHKPSSTILDDFKDARDTFDFGVSSTNHTGEFANADGFQEDEETNVFDPDYYEASSILKDESVNSLITEPLFSKPEHHSAAEHTHINKSPSMKDLALPKFIAEDAATGFKKSPKVNDFKFQVDGTKPDFHHTQQQGTPTYTNQPQFSNTNRPAAALQPMVSVNTESHSSSGPQGLQGSYGNPYQKQSPSQPYMNVTPTQPFHQPQFANNSPRNQHQFAVNQHQNTGNSAPHQHIHPQRPAPPTAMAGGPAPGPSVYGYPPNGRVVNPNAGRMPPSNNYAQQHPNVGKPVPPQMQMGRPMHSPTSPHFKNSSVKPAPLKKSGPGGFAQFMPPTPTTNPYTLEEDIASTNKTAKNDVSTKTTTKKNTLNELKRIFQLAKPETGMIALALLCILLSSVVSMIVPSVIGKLLDHAQKQYTRAQEILEGLITKENDEECAEKDEEEFIYGLTKVQFYSALGAVFVLGAVANTTRVIILKLTGEKLVSRLRTKLLNKVFAQDASFWDRNRTGDIISRLSTDCSIVSRTVTTNISDGSRSLLQGVAGFCMMSVISWKLTLVMVTIIPPLGVLAAVYGRRVKQLSRMLQEKVGSLTKVSEEQLGSIKMIQNYGAERLELNKYSTEVRKVFQVGVKEALTSGGFFGVTGLVGNIALIALLLTGTNMIQAGALSVGELSSFMMYALYTGSSMFGLSNFYSELMKGAGAATRVFDLYDEKPSIPPTVGKVNILETSLSRNTPTITFENVKFRYPTRPESSVFANLNLSINPGEHVCIVGPSGCGKSSFMALLLRYYDLESGKIKVGDYDLKDFNLRKFRRMIGVVQQEPILVNGSILENIQYALPRDDYSKDEIERAVAESNCHKFLDSFPAGLDTPVGPRGAKLSGGQKQRVALARAFLMDPNILLLDEATSALDTVSESIVAQTLEKRRKEGKTTISIAHRRSTIEHSSRVIVLSKDGMVAESGTFEELIADPESHLNELLANKN